MTTQTSQKRFDANRRNAEKSTGPRTPEGKSRSRFNRLEHGLAATVPVLPGEDPTAFQARVDAVVESFGPQNQVEFDLLERVAATSWAFDRATRAEAARLSYKIRHDAIEREQREKEEALMLGQRLLWDARGPWQLFPHMVSQGLKWERRTSWSENPADPNNPALLVARLERTVAGCQWLLDRWAELQARLEPGEVWVAPDQFKAVRLLGKQPLDAIDDPDVTQIFTASFKLLPDGQNGGAFAPLERELMANRHEDDVYNKELRQRQLAKLRPRDADAAREVLRALVDRQASRLKLIRARNQEIAEADAAEAPNRLAFDPNPEGEKLRRYVLAAARSVNQTIKTYLSVVRCQLSVEDSSLVPGPLSATPDKQAAPEAKDHEAAPEAWDGRGPGEIPPTEPNVESSVVICPLSVVNQDSQAAPEAKDHQAAPEAWDGRGPGEIPPTEPNVESSVVICPLSVVNQDSQAGREAQDNQTASWMCAGRGPGEIPRTEPNSGPDVTSNRGQRTTDEGQLTDPAPPAAGGHLTVPRTEPNAANDQAVDNRQPIKDRGRAPEPSPSAAVTSCDGQRTTDHGQRTIAGLSE